MSYLRIHVIRTITIIIIIIIYFEIDYAVVDVELTEADGAGASGIVAVPGLARRISPSLQKKLRKGGQRE